MRVTFEPLQAFIEDPTSLSRKLYGSVDKILAAEWAKFRWGVFDDRNRQPLSDIESGLHNLRLGRIGFNWK